MGEKKVGGEDGRYRVSLVSSAARGTSLPEAMKFHYDSGRVVRTLSTSKKIWLR